MLASESVYVSGTFWASIALAALAIITIAVTVVLWRRGGPRRLIVWSTPVVTSLLSSHAPQGGQIYVGILTGPGESRTLTDPYLVRLHVESRSRKDISRRDFDGERPLVFRLGAKFVSQIGDSTAWADGLEIAIENDEIKIGPSLVRKGQLLMAEILTEGRPGITCSNPLPDIVVREETGSSRLETVARILGAVPVLGLWTLVLIQPKGITRLEAIVIMLFLTNFFIGIWVLSIITSREIRSPDGRTP